MVLRIVPGVSWSANCYLLLDEEQNKLLIIDLGLDGRLTGYSLRKSLEELLGENSENFDVEVFLTHCHIDHIAGENNLPPFKSLIFSASKTAAEHINSRDHVTLLQQFGGKITYSVEKTYEDGATFSFAGNEFQVLHCPGHTNGSAVLFSPNMQALFSGDVVFKGSIGRMDLPTGNPEEMRHSLKRLLEYDIQHLYSGHGEALHRNVKKNIQKALQLF
ncbi:MAG: MBL fold metallo-hydrolase [Candidatus Heimdallarchaeota archaeon]|nr:MBL fold metallo-hydrolase [Candidatus Heimdallarchaeota archaeon]